MILSSPLQKTALLFSLGLLFYYWLSTSSFQPKLPPEVLEGEIQHISAYPSGGKLEVNTSWGLAWLYLSFVPENCYPGDVFQAYIQPTSQGYLNLFSWPRITFYRAKGLHFVAKVQKPEDLRCLSPSRKSVLKAVRSRLFSFSEKLSPTARGLFSALVLGEKGPLPEEFKERLQTQGLYHFLAVSGFHLGLLYGALYWITRWLLKMVSLPVILPAQIPASLTGFGGAAFYALLSGPSPSAERALVMLGLFTLSQIFFLRTSGFDLLAGTVLVILLFSPESVLDLSFRLSVAAVLGILIAHRLYRRLAFRRARLLEYLSKGLAVSLGASLATLPFLLYTFGQAPLLSPLNTLLLSPLWCLILIPGEILTAVLVFLKEDWALGLAEFLGKVLTFFLERPLPEITLVPPFPVGLFLFFLLFSGLSLYLFFKKRYRLFLVSLLLSAGFLAAGLYVRYGLFYLLFFDIGKGNAILAHLPGNHNLLFDAGARYGRFDLGKRILVPELHKLGITRLDLVVLSHPDLDHTGGLPALLENFSVKRIVTGIFSVKEWKKLGLETKFKELHQAQNLRIGSAEIFLFPGAVPARDPNRESLVSFLDYQGLTVFFTGDIDAQRLKRLFEKQAILPSEVFVLPHHGSRDGFFAPAWRALRFKVAIASARGRFHPHSLVVKILENYRRPLYVTAKHGALTVFQRGQSFWVCPVKRLKGGLPLEAFWPYIPYLDPKRCDRYVLHTLRDL